MVRDSSRSQMMMFKFDTLDRRIAMGERMYHAAAGLVRGKYQAILWYEWLPALLGPVEYAKLPPYSGYNASVDPSVTNEFGAAASSFWHSQLPPEVPRLDIAFNPSAAGPIPLRDAYFATPRVLSESGLNPILRGAWASAAQESDILYVDDVRTQFLGANSLGLDLASFDIQQGRDHGLPAYNTVRAVLGLDRVESFAALVSSLPEKAAARVAGRLAELYRSVDDVDLLVGGLLEGHVEGGTVGPTFAGVIREQMVRTRDGDRFWFENDASPLYDVVSVFADAAQLRKTRLADVISAVTDIHPSAFELSTAESARIREPATTGDSTVSAQQRQQGSSSTNTPSMFYTRRSSKQHR
jgi:peroxidase